jgi:hypothetical protein
MWLGRDITLCRRHQSIDSQGFAHRNLSGCDDLNGDKITHLDFGISSG